MPPIIPVLMSDINSLSKPVDIIKHVLRAYVTAPKNINDTFANQEISLVYDDAECGHNPEQLQGRAQGSIRSVLVRYFSESAVTVDVTTSVIDAARYSLVIDIIVVVDNVPYAISNNFVLGTDGLLEYNFQG